MQLLKVREGKSGKRRNPYPWRGNDDDDDGAPHN